MIQKIVKNSDIKFCVDEDSKIQDKFIIKFYTIDKAKGITRTADDVIVKDGKRYIKLNWSTIKLLDNGMLNYEVNNLDSDADYDDGVYNSTFTRTTYYYLCTDGDGLADAIEEIELRVDQITTDITGLKSNNATITTQMGDLQNRMSSAETKSNNNEENITGLQNRMSVVETKSTNNEENITGLQNRMSVVETKSTNNENSINTMSTDYAALVSRLERLEANGSNKPDSLDDRVSALEKSKDSIGKRIEEAERINNQVLANYPTHIYADELDNKFTQLYQRVSALERGTQGSNGSTSSLATNNDSIVNRASALENEPSALETEPSALATNNDSIDNRVSALEDNYQRLDNNMSTAVEKPLKDIVERFPLWSQANDFDIIVSTLEMRVSALERGTQGSNGSTSTLATNNDNIVNRASALETEPSALETEPSALETEPSALETEPSALETNNDNIANRASALATDNDSIANRVSALENSAEDFKNRISELYSWIFTINDHWTEDYSWHYFFNESIDLNKRITALETR